MSHPVLATQSYTPGTAKNIRLEGNVPAVVYGKGKETKSIAINTQEFRRAFRKAGRATLVDLQMGEELIPALIHVIDVHPLSGDPVHVDFHAVDMSTKIHAVVPVSFEGTPDAVKLLGGTFTTIHNQISIECLPKNLLSGVTVDISGMKTFHDKITVGDVPFPDNITVLDASDMLVAAVNPPRVAESELTSESSVDTAVSTDVDTE